ncbi:MAG: esterase-like activity of phytase family protein [Alphaproteobacteria bacterium]
MHAIRATGMASLALAACLASPPAAPAGNAAPDAISPGEAGPRAIEDPGQGIRSMHSPWPGTVELSGLTWVQADRWLAVSDRMATIHALDVSLDAAGRVSEASVHAGVRLEGARDPEGVAYAPESAAVFVSDEVGPAIREYEPATGRLLRQVPVPAIFAGTRHNLGFESLTRDPATGVSWTANEEALASDGPSADAVAGTLVRLQRFDRDWQPDGQWAWRTEPLRPGGKGTTGVSDLVALPDGGLLVLERSFGDRGVHVSLWEADLGSAPEVQAIPALGRDTPVLRKRLLWEAETGRFDFEGAALGPSLRDGGRALLLVSDDGRGGEFGLYPLVLRPSADARRPPAHRSTTNARTGAAGGVAGPRSRPRPRVRRLQDTGGLLTP